MFEKFLQKHFLRNFLEFLGHKRITFWKIRVLVVTDNARVLQFCISTSRERAKRIGRSNLVNVITYTWVETNRKKYAWCTRYKREKEATFSGVKVTDPAGV